MLVVRPSINCNSPGRPSIKASRGCPNHSTACSSLTIRSRTFQTTTTTPTVITVLIIIISIIRTYIVFKCRVYTVVSCSCNMRRTCNQKLCWWSYSIKAIVRVGIVYSWLRRCVICLLFLFSKLTFKFYIFNLERLCTRLWIYKQEEEKEESLLAAQRATRTAQGFVRQGTVTKNIKKYTAKPWFTFV